MYLFKLWRVIMEKITQVQLDEQEVIKIHDKSNYYATYSIKEEGSNFVLVNEFEIIAFDTLAELNKELEINNILRDYEIY